MSLTKYLHATFISMCCNLKFTNLNKTCIKLGIVFEEKQLLFVALASEGAKSMRNRYCVDIHLAIRGIVQYRKITVIVGIEATKSP